MAEARIAVDARPLCHPGTGIYRYTKELLRRICGFGGEWFLYSPQAYDTADLCAPNIYHRVGGVHRSLRASQLGQLFFPVWARRDRVSVFWSPRHQLPLYLPAGIRAVVTIHDLVWKRHGETMRFPGRQIEGFLMPRSLQRADVVVAVSDFTRRELNTCFAQIANPVQLVPGASHLDALQQSLGCPGNDTSPYFLFVGTMEPRKNLRLVLQAYREYALRHGQPLPLQIAGGRGWGGVDVNTWVRELGLEELVTVAGKVSDAQLADLYAHAHALVMPSLYEGFGLPVVESLSLGVPVIVSRDSALSEVAGSAGLLVDPTSEVEVTGALLAMSDDLALHGALKRRAPVEAARYNWDESAAKMAAILLP